MQAVPSTTSIRSGTFWAHVQPGEHLLQCYAHEDSLLDALEGFVSSGLRLGEGVVVIATAPHLHELEKRLRAHWLDIDRARWEQRYIPLLAQEVLAKFMGADHMPDDEMFDRTVMALVTQARGPGRRVRCFGEMVSMLWAQGNVAATIQVENLWTALLRRENIPLLCAYSRTLFAGHPPTALRGVCDLHTLLLPG
jgi:MEDS: MEthanogen/methylotroph, DcmR Sensory domain